MNVQVSLAAAMLLVAALVGLAWCISIVVVLAVVAGSRERSRQDHPSSGGRFDA